MVGECRQFELLERRRLARIMPGIDINALDKARG
jgi:hypothetical protein